MLYFAAYSGSSHSAESAGTFVIPSRTLTGAGNGLRTSDCARAVEVTASAATARTAAAKRSDRIMEHSLAGGCRSLLKYPLMAPTPPALVSDAPLGAARKWAITFSVMMVTVMQVLDTSITNVALPHMQGSFSASIDEMSWVITSYLAANAVIIPASGWLTAVFGRRRFYLICTVTFTASSFLSGIAPNLEFLVLMRILQGLGGGPVIPMAQAIMWEIFPLKERGTAMADCGFGIMLAPILGPTVGGWIAVNWSWRWIFYINIPIGFVGFVMVSIFLFDSPFAKKPRGIDAYGLVLMVFGFGCLQLMLDFGEKEDWFQSDLIVGLLAVAVC